MICVNDMAARQHAVDEDYLTEISQRITGRVSDLTAKGAEFYPYTREHIMNFLGDMLPHQELVLCTAIENPGVDYTALLRHWIGMYYEGLAEKQAIRELEGVSHE